MSDYTVDSGWKWIVFDTDVSLLQLFTNNYSCSQSIRLFLLGSSGTLSSWTCY
jgi:hypothetical protein